MSVFGVVLVRWSAAVVPSPKVQFTNSWSPSGSRTVAVTVIDSPDHPWPETGKLTFSVATGGKSAAAGLIVAVVDAQTGHSESATRT